MKVSEQLIQLGLSQNEATVYEALIELGQSKAGAVIKKTGLHRNIVYEALAALVEKQLVFKTSKGGVALFQLSDATTFIRDAQSALRLAEEVAERINHQRQQAGHEVKLYEGFSGLKSMRESAIQDLEQESDPAQREMLVLGAGVETTTRYYDSFYQQNDRERAEKNISARLLFPTSITDYAERVAETDKTDVRFLPQSIQDPTVIDIWQDNVAFIMHDIEPFIVSIKNKKLAHSFRQHFESLWNQDVQVLRGAEAIQAQIMEDSLNYKENWFIGGNGGIHRIWPEYWADYNRRRIEKGIWWHDLVDRDMVMPGIQEAPPGVQDHERYYEFKWMPQELSSPSVIFMYGKKVCVITWEAEPEPIAFVIEDQEVFDAYLKYHQFLWNQDIVVTHGLEQVKQLFLSKMKEMNRDEVYKVLWASYGDDSTREDIMKWFRDYHIQRTKRGVRLELIGDASNKESISKEMVTNADPNMEMTKFAFMRNETGSPMQINIYPDSVMLIYWAKGKKATAIEIAKKEVRNAMDAYFQAMWELSE